MELSEDEGQEEAMEEGEEEGLARADGLGFNFRSQPHVCFCGKKPCPHVDFTGTPTEHKVLASTQEKTDREKATDFASTIDDGTPLASKGDVADSTSGGEPLWLSIAKGALQVNKEKFTAAGGAGASGTRTIAFGWSYVDIAWLVKIKTDSDGNVHYEAWRQPHDERTVLTNKKWLSEQIEWLRVEEPCDGLPQRYVLGADTYQRLLDAVK